ncbi:MAG: redoxin family protein [Alphaproteobacteria bacterium]|nr:redoxin family protein [Alphaproteobacteria bacterium]
MLSSPRNKTVDCPNSTAAAEPLPCHAVYPTRRACILAVAGILVSGPAATAAPPNPDFDLADYRGKVLYLDFWASWCGPCHLSFPYMNGLTTRFPGSDLAVIAVDVDHDRAKADAFLKRFGGNVPILFDSSGKLATRFGVKEMPTSILIGRDGSIRYIHKGFFPEKTPLYDAHITELLHER